MGGVGVGVGVGDGEGEKGREGMLGVLVTEWRKPGVLGGNGIWYTLLLLARGCWLDMSRGQSWHLCRFSFLAEEKKGKTPFCYWFSWPSSSLSVAERSLA